MFHFVAITGLFLEISSAAFEIGNYTKGRVQSKEKTYLFVKYVLKLIHERDDLWATQLPFILTFVVKTISRTNWQNRLILAVITGNAQIGLVDNQSDSRMFL